MGGIREAKSACSRVLVCGGRDYSDRDHIWNTLVSLDCSRGPFKVVIHGCATGADSEAMIWAQTCGRKHAPFQADWHKHGKAAGPIRNQRMIDEGKPDLVIAFPGGTGTADMVRRAKAAGLEVITVSRCATDPALMGTLADAPSKSPSPPEGKSE